MQTHIICILLIISDKKDLPGVAYLTGLQYKKERSLFNYCPINIFFVNT
jgi:hypothetical protein